MLAVIDASLAGVSLVVAFEVVVGSFRGEKAGADDFDLGLTTGFVVGEFVEFMDFGD